MLRSLCRKPGKYYDRYSRGCLIGWAAACLLAAFLLVPRSGRGQEPSAVDAAAALQEVLVSAIERAGKSVVAIARVRKEERGARSADDMRNPLQFEASPFGFSPDANPTSPDFVPNEFASGVVLDREGHILTNYHVLGNPEQNDYFVWAQRRPFQVASVEVPQEVKAGDPWTDLAVLKISASDLEPMPLGDASKLRKGMLVIALGNPYGIARDGEVSASWGIVSNLRRATAPNPQNSALGAERSRLDQYGTLIQTDARLDLGTSGGALVNLQGEMIGLTTSLAATVGYEQAGGFAIPVDEAFHKAVETLRQGRLPAFGFLGVQPDHLPLADRQAGRFGARVLRVIPGTPAAKAGLQPDDVITHVNHERVFDKNSLFRELSQLPADETVNVTFERREMPRQQPKTLTATAVLSKKYVASSQVPYAQVQDPPWRGMLVEYPSALPPQLSTQGLQAVDPEGCVAIAQVERDSPAWEAGLRRGEYISHVGTQRVSTPREFYAAVAQQPGKVRLQITAGRRETSDRTVVVE
ncbi:MAG: trypsin-like peptidase domain-containing protein [Pirellulaceae bacterium]